MTCGSHSQKSRKTPAAEQTEHASDDDISAADTHSDSMDEDESDSDADSVENSDENVEDESDGASDEEDDSDGASDEGDETDRASDEDVDHEPSKPVIQATGHVGAPDAAVAAQGRVQQAPEPQRPPLRKSDVLGGTVFVRGLPLDVSKAEVQARLETYGRVRDCRYVPSEPCGF